MPASSIQLALLTVVAVLDGAVVVAVFVEPEVVPGAWLPEVAEEVTLFVPEVPDEVAGFGVDVVPLLEPCTEDVDSAAVARAVVAEPAEPAIAPIMARVAEALATPATRRARRAGCRRRGAAPRGAGRAAPAVPP